MPIPTTESPSIAHPEADKKSKTIFLETKNKKPSPRIKDVSTPDTVISSSYSSSNDTSSSGSVSTSDSDELEIVQDLKNLMISEHKRLEIEGKHKPDPMLEENAGRFVLFPIQHPDVSFSLSVMKVFLCTLVPHQTLSVVYQIGLGNV